jgi:tRNA C32,U32 (ribose-2'-O)-methylase TrmJ
MIKIINKYKQAFTVVGAISVLVICYLQQKELTKLRNETKIEVFEGGDITKAQTIDSLQHLVDSLDSENYPCQIEKNRYEVAFKIFAERNPKAAEQYAEIISSETE